MNSFQQLKSDLTKIQSWLPSATRIQAQRDIIQDYQQRPGAYIDDQRLIELLVECYLEQEVRKELEQKNDIVITASSYVYNQETYGDEWVYEAMSQGLSLWGTSPDNRAPDGLGCNNCYSCISGGSKPCLLEKNHDEEEKYDADAEEFELSERAVSVPIYVVAAMEMDGNGVGDVAGDAEADDEYEQQQDGEETEEETEIEARTEAAEALAKEETETEEEETETEEEETAQFPERNRFHFYMNLALA